MKTRFFLLAALAILAGCAKPGDDGNKPTPVDPSQDVAVTGITVSPGSAQLAVGGTVTLTATVMPDNATDKTVTWSTSNSAVATVAGGLVTGVAAGSATITAKAGDKTASCAITVAEPPHAPEGAVDLGLSVYWATCNLGASTPEGFGDFYCWGEIVPNKEKCSWLEYKWAVYKDEEYYTLPYVTKYCHKDQPDAWGGEGEPDGLMVLLPEDDAATVVLGGKWRMPTPDEFSELCELSSRTAQKNGVDGWELIGKNGNILFLPKAPLRYNNTYSAVPEEKYIEVPNAGDYWSSGIARYTSEEVDFIYYRSQDALKLGFHDNDNRPYFNGHHQRHYALPIRPVYPKE